MIDPIFYDTETIGLTGPIVLLQYKIGNGPINLYCPWKQTIQETIDLFEMLCNHKGGLVGFNLVYDHFHLYQMWTVLQLMPDKDAYLEDCIDLYAELEPRGRDYPDCLKPIKCLDLLLHARKTSYQSTMERAPIRIKRVPTILAAQLRDELEKRIQLKDIYFARRKDKKADKWKIFDTDDDDFKNIVLRFSASTALKALAVDALGVEEDKILLFQDISIEKKYYPVEYGYAPFAKAVGSKENWNKAWPEFIHRHISHWCYNTAARTYAAKDVEYTHGLYEHFKRPELGDNDSELTICVACCRWRGYKIDIDGIKFLRKKAIDKKYKDNKKIPISPRAARRYIIHGLSEVEAVAIAGSTKKVVLEKLSKATKDCECVKIREDQDDFSDLTLDDLMNSDAPLNTPTKFKDVDPNCKICGGIGEVLQIAAIRAKEILEARQSDKERELYEKLLLAGRFHASFNVIGTLSSRMSGSDKLNAQGIKKTGEVRSKFPLSNEPYILCGGDFSGFEVALAEAVYKDEALRADLLSKRPCHKCKGTIKKTCKECNGTGEVPTSIHALFGMSVYPDMTYEEILATKGTKDDRYTRSKSAMFAMLYGGEGTTLQDRLGVDLETANKAYKAFTTKYPKVGIARKQVFDSFCAMRQPGGIGTRVEWHEPSDYIESPAGFRRYFTLENKICKALFEIANRPPKEWQKLKVKVQRRDREQTAVGAVQSSLYACAFTLQAANMRAACNHVIQSYGATITKDLQRSIWDIQPSGVHKWLIEPMNVHDEVLAPVAPEIVDKVKEVVYNKVESYRPKVPLIDMEWKIGITNWAEK